MIKDEIWRDIPDHPNYEVSDLGRIYSKRSRIILAYSAGNHGYVRVELEEGRRFNIHDLVLLAFVGPCPIGMEGSHKDGVRNNNVLDNLVWESHIENMRRIHNKVTKEQVIEIRDLSKRGFSNTDIGKQYDISESYVSRICTRKLWRELC
jgi:DNA-binding NarL/FixJ family response regulator